MQSNHFITSHYINSRDNIKHNYKTIPDTNIRFCDLDASQRIGIFMMLSRFFEKNYILAIVSKHLTTKQYNYLIDSLTYILANSISNLDNSSNKDYSFNRNNIFNSSNIFKGLDSLMLSDIFTNQVRFNIFIEIIEYEMNACGVRRSLKQRETILNMCKKILTTSVSEHTSFFDLYMRLGSICFSGMFNNIFDYAYNGPINEQAIQEYKDFFKSFNIPLEKTRFIADRRTYSKNDLLFLQSQKIYYVISVEHQDIFDKCNNLTDKNNIFTNFTSISSSHAQNNFICTVNDYLSSNETPLEFTPYLCKSSKYQTTHNSLDTTKDSKNALTYNLNNDQLNNKIRVICITKKQSLDQHLYDQANKAFYKYIINKNELKQHYQYSKFFSQNLMNEDDSCTSDLALSDLAVEVLAAKKYATTYLITNDINVSTENFTTSWSRRNFFTHNFLNAQKDIRTVSEQLSHEIEFILSNILAVIHAVINVSINSTNTDAKVEAYRLAQISSGLDLYKAIKRINNIYMYFQNNNLLFHPNENQVNLLKLFDIDYVKISPFIIETAGYQAIWLDHKEQQINKGQTLKSNNCTLILK